MSASSRASFSLSPPQFPFRFFRLGATAGRVQSPRLAPVDRQFVFHPFLVEGLLPRILLQLPDLRVAAGLRGGPGPPLFHLLFQEVPLSRKLFAGVLQVVNHGAGSQHRSQMLSENAGPGGGRDSTRKRGGGAIFLGRGVSFPGASFVQGWFGSGIPPEEKEIS
jgi:hypothetical protein